MDTKELKKNSFYRAGRAIARYEGISFKERKAMIRGIELGLMAQEDNDFSILNSDNFLNIHYVELGFNDNY